MFKKILKFLGTVIGPDKVGGYVRAGAGAALTFLFTWANTKIPYLSSILTPELNATLAVATSTAVVGVWSQLVKS